MQLRSLFDYGSMGLLYQHTVQYDLILQYAFIIVPHLSLTLLHRILPDKFQVRLP
jgi:hypothetical protein